MGIYEVIIIMIKRIILLISFILLTVGCEKVFSPKDYFEVRVVTFQGNPVVGAKIEGGIDWWTFRVETNENGVAILPRHALGEKAVIHKNNFFPDVIASLMPTKYILNPTPRQLKLVGNVDGWSIQFSSGNLITVGYGGGYHVYSYNDQSVTEIASAQLPQCIKMTQLRGDTLWFSTHDSGIYVYSLQNQLQPQLLFHLAIPGYLGPFVIKDSIIIVGNPWNQGPIRIYTYKPNGQFRELSNFGNYLVVKMAIISNYLIVVNYYENLPAIIDLQDPTNPNLIYNGIEPEYWSGFLFRNYLILIPRTAWENITNINYKLINLSNPANPLTVGTFSADSRLYEITNDSIALGAYYSTGHSSVLIGGITSRFQTIAIISGIDGFGGCAPPYFIVNGNLWKLQE